MCHLYVENDDCYLTMLFCECIRITRHSWSHFGFCIQCVSGEYISKAHVDGASGKYKMSYYIFIKLRALTPWLSNIERQCVKLHQKIEQFIKQVYMNESSQMPNVIDRCWSVITAFFVSDVNKSQLAGLLKCKEFINVDIICVANTVITISLV